MKKIKIGVLGGYRGSSMINYCKIADNAEIVAICDNNPEVLNAQKKLCDGHGITFYDDFDDFIEHGMDAVVLANFATEHAPFAIKAMRKGKHVFSEVLPVQTMKEAVELIEAVEETGRLYAYAENYCYMPACYEMKRLYESNKLGELEYAECEYIHNCESIWPDITYGCEDHWRNNIYSTFYCTHSLGPIVHATSLRPVKVTGFESTMNERNLRCGSKNGQFGIEMVTFENGGIVKSVHGNLYRNSIWYSIYGSKGRAECPREDANDGHISRIYVNYDEYSGEYRGDGFQSYLPVMELDEQCKSFGHGGSDFYSIYNFVEKVRGNKSADTIDVYEALDMFLPGMFAYRSILAGGIPMDIPDLRKKSEREKWRSDTACTSPEAAGDMLLPTAVGGTPKIDPKVYVAVKETYEKNKNKVGGYRQMAFRQGSGKNK